MVKYQTMEQVGKKLLATWKSVARLEESEKKELDQFCNGGGSPRYSSEFE